MAVNQPGRSYDGLQRGIVLVLTLVALLFVVYWALQWTPGGVVTDSKGTPLLDHGRPIPASHGVADVVAIVAVATTFAGTILGVYFGASSRSRSVDEALKAASASNANAVAANGRAASAETQATTSYARAAAAEKAQADARLALATLLSTVDKAKVHVKAADPALESELMGRVSDVKAALS